MSVRCSTTSTSARAPKSGRVTTAQADSNPSGSRKVKPRSAKASRTRRSASARSDVGGAPMSERAVPVYSG